MCGRPAAGDLPRNKPVSTFLDDGGPIGTSKDGTQIDLTAVPPRLRGIEEGDSGKKKNRKKKKKKKGKAKQQQQQSDGQHAYTPADLQLGRQQLLQFQAQLQQWQQGLQMEWMKINQERQV